jgi:site-specific DNA-cytosine methylase
MEVLSVFDGISCAQVALQRAGIKVNKYYASEIDKEAIKITQKNFPNTIQLGSITEITGLHNILKLTRLHNIDLLIGGSPCQGFSLAGKQLNFNDERSKLFFEFVRLLKEFNPKYFLLENVLMKKEYQDVISNCLGVQPIKINANLVSAQDRSRLFWTNIPVNGLPVDRKIFLRDIIEEAGEDITERMLKKVPGTLAYNKTWGNVRTLNQKAKTLTASGQSIANSGATNIKLDNGRYKKLTPIECERLQSLPDNYTLGASSDTQRYHMTGNAFNVDVVAFILSHINLGNSFLEAAASSENMKQE